MASFLVFDCGPVPHGWGFRFGGGLVIEQVDPVVAAVVAVVLMAVALWQRREWLGCKRDSRN